MGVDTAAKLKGIVPLEQLEKKLQESYITKTPSYPSKDSLTLDLIIGGNHRRGLFIHFNKQDNYTYLNLSHDQEAVSIIRSLVEYFGGEFIECTLNEGSKIWFVGEINTQDLICSAEEKVLFNAQKIGLDFRQQLVTFMENNKEDLLEMLS